MKRVALLSLCSFVCLSANGSTQNPNEETERRFAKGIAKLLGMDPGSTKYYEGRTTVVPLESVRVDGKDRTKRHPATEIKCHAKIENDGENIKMTLTTQKYWERTSAAPNESWRMLVGNSVVVESHVGYDYKDLKKYRASVDVGSNKVARKVYAGNLADQVFASVSLSGSADSLDIKAASYQTAFLVIPFNTDAEQARKFDCDDMMEVSRGQYEKEYEAPVPALRKN